MVTSLDESLMRHALNEAWKYQGLTFPNPAVGAVVSDETGQIVGIGAHQKAGMPHAEVLALKHAYRYLSGDERIDALESASDIHTFLSQNHTNLFHTLTLHVTLEPCHHYGKTPPCSELIYTLGLKRVVIGMQDKSLNAKGGADFLHAKGVEVDFDCLQEACEELLTPFTCKEKKEPFVFFKLALSANGVATGGLISSLESRTMVHRLRDCCDLLVIGGNTVRIDKPILDARLCQGKAPDILIYSHSKSFDSHIPLFHVENRNVFIETTLEKMKEYAFVMIEGGQGMLDAIKNDVKWYLIFRSPKIKEDKSIELPEDLREVFSQKIGEDTMSWYVR